MKVGIGLPNAVPGVDRSATVDWARRAEEAGFSSLGTLGRLAYVNYDCLVSLAATAAVTERIGLMTDILLAPLHANVALLAKQTATIDSLSNGRLVLGLAPGGRQDDFELSGVPFHERGRIFDRQLPALKELWSGHEVGPAPAQEGGPPILVGGRSPATFRRAAEHGAGWTMGGGTPDQLREGRAALEEQWRKHGREGAPRLVALAYYALGPNAEELAREDLMHYYAILGEEIAQMIVAGTATDEQTVKDYVAGFAEAGCDELILFPTGTGLEQVDLLADAVL